MIDDLDEALRLLFIRELPIKNSEVNVEFDQPKREWSARVSQPTLNIFLYDVQENTRLRYKERQTTLVNSHVAVQRMTPVRIDLRYILTAWAAEPEDEHRLLTRSMLVLFRTPELPEDLLPESLRSQPAPIPLETAQPGELQNLTDLWSVLDNEMKPAVAFTVTLAINPYAPVTTPLVRSRELRTYQVTGRPLPAAGEAAEQPPVELVPVAPAGVDELWTIGGRICGDRPLSDLALTLIERGMPVPLLENGRFTIGQLRAGVYTLEVTVKGEKPDSSNPRRYPIKVPAPDYELHV